MTRAKAALKVLVTPDKFKGTLTAEEASRSIAEGWRRERPNDQIDFLPMSDGGDGFGAVLGRILDAEPQVWNTVDAARRDCNARWWWRPEEKIAILETAQVIGLALLPEGRFHPFDLDTAGLASLLREIDRRGAKVCLAGIGGSATNDGGFGLARALGWNFLDAASNEIERWTDLRSLARIRPPQHPPLKCEIQVAVDVQNPLLGERGATRVYGPQKGLSETDFPAAEACLTRLSECLAAETGRDLQSIPGAGAAGGLGFGLAAFVSARLESGFDVFARFADLHGRLDAADLVLTGEGALDASTVMGKGVGEVARACAKRNTPCLGLGGALSEGAESALIEAGFTAVYGASPQLTDSTSARRDAHRWLSELAALAAREWRQC